MTNQPHKLPQQINPRRPEDTAVAPYNFVPLPEQVVTVDPNTLPDQDRYYGSDADHHYTGTIQCKLITETPLYVRAALVPEDYQTLDTLEDQGKPYYERVKNRPDFFYTNWTKTPVIPGSSLRGMVRSLVEMVSHSKFESASQQPLVYRAVGDTTSHGNNYRDKIMRKDSEGYDEENKRYQAYTPLVKAGYVLRDKNGGWEIQPARQIGGATFARIHHNLLRPYESRLKRVAGTHNAYYIYIQSGPLDYQRIRGGLIRTRYAKTLRASDRMGTGLFQGVLARSGAIFSKRTEAVVFPLDPNATPISIPDHLAQAYLDQLTPEQKNLLGLDGVLTLAKQDAQSKAHGKTEGGTVDGEIIDHQPVFYLINEQGKLVFFGHTMMMRLPYPKSPFEMVPDYLRKEEQVDLTEAIFGYTKSKETGKAKAYAGRVFFSDAHLDRQIHDTSDDLWFAEQPIVPKILASPKATAFQHYLVQQTPSPQVSGETRDGRPKYEKVLADYTANEEQTTLRGQKLYWHKGKVALGDIHEPIENLQKMQRERPDRQMRDSQYTQINPVRAGVHFTFELRFENLSGVELGALLWALTIPGREGEVYRHKLGMAKPYGMGAVQIVPILQLQDRRKRYTQLFVSDDNNQVQWAEGAQTMATADPSTTLIHDFERHILQELAGAAKNPPQRLHELRRVQVMLALMRWPGPNPQETRYMEIERPDPNDKRGKVNEYRTRPVLPSPLPTGREETRTVVAAPSKATYSTAEPPATERKSAVAADFAAFLRGSATESTSTKPTEPTNTPSTATTPVDRPVSPQEIKEGMYLEGIVLRVEKERVVVDLQIAGADEASLLIEQIMPPITPTDEWAARFPNGSTIRAWVRRINQRGRVQLTMKGPK